jgi:hypothetical protein
MNINDLLNDLDTLILEHTKAPATALLRNRVSSIREQVEALQKDAEPNTKTPQATWGSEKRIPGRME